jgi:glycerophosphoryl diester phosphodiesterase
MFSFVTAAGVDAVHEAGLRVSAWTVDAREDMARVVADGVDGVVSNGVAELVAFLRR